MALLAELLVADDMAGRTDAGPVSLRIQHSANSIFRKFNTPPSALRKSAYSCKPFDTIFKIQYDAMNMIKYAKGPKSRGKSKSVSE
jgi:hypothetical protein